MLKFSSGHSFRPALKTGALAALTAAWLLGSAPSAHAQTSNFTFDPAKSVLIDKATGRQWACGFGRQYANEYLGELFTYTGAVQSYPGNYSACPYGDGGGWRVPTTAEFQDALRKGLWQEMENVVAWCSTQPKPPELLYYPHGFHPNHWIWVVDPKATKRSAYAVVISTGERKQTNPGSGLMSILCRN